MTTAPAEVVRAPAPGQNRQALSARVRAAVQAFGLTKKQAIVAEMVALGHTDAKIAESMGLSTNTIRTHLRHVYLQLRIGSRALLVATILRQILTGEDAGHDRGI